MLCSTGLKLLYCMLIVPGFKFDLFSIAEKNVESFCDGAGRAACLHSAGPHGEWRRNAAENDDAENDERW